MYFKEVALLNRLRHTNIVQFKAFCCKPYAIMMDYVYFDFSLFGENMLLSTLSDFLLQIDEYDCEGFEDLVVHAGKEIIKGVSYLHSQQIAHRDLKPTNILVSNQHYINIADGVKKESFYRSRPIICKLTDFGESRSQLIQTQTMLATKTSTVERGTQLYMAPEIILPEALLQSASMSDLLLIDIWALGMVFFSLINPNIKYPFYMELRSASISSKEGVKKFMCERMRKNEIPETHPKYRRLRSTVWRNLQEIFVKCLNYNREKRINLEHAKVLLESPTIFTESNKRKREAGLVDCTSFLNELPVR